MKSGKKLAKKENLNEFKIKSVKALNKCVIRKKQLNA